MFRSFKNKETINQAFTTDLNIYDILAVVCFNNGKYRSSLRYINKALELDKDNERLINNKKLIEKYINQSQYAIIFLKVSSL